MALKSGIVSFMRRSLALVQSELSSSSALNLSQRCSLTTSSVASLILHKPLLRSSNQCSKINGDKVTFSQPPLTAGTFNILPVRNYHSVLRPRLHCKGCYFVWRHGRKFVECSDTPSHKQMKKVINRKLWKEDYTKGNVRKAMMWNRDLPRISDRMCDRDVLSHNWMASRIGTDV